MFQLHLFINLYTVGPPFNFPPYIVFLLIKIKNDPLKTSGGPASLSLYRSNGDFKLNCTGERKQLKTVNQTAAI